MAAAGNDVIILDSYPEGQKGKSFESLEKAGKISFIVPELEKLQESLDKNGCSREEFSKKLKNLPAMLRQLIEEKLPTKECFTEEEIAGAIKAGSTISFGGNLKIVQSTDEITDRQDLIVTTVKNGALNEKLAEKVKSVPQDKSTPVAVCANGVLPWVLDGGNKDSDIYKFVDKVGHKKLLGGVLTRYTAENIGGGVVKSCTPAHTSNFFGKCYAGGSDKSLEEVREIYAATGVKTEAGELKKVVFSKLGINLISGVLSTIIGRTEMNLTDEKLLKTIRRVATEYYNFADKVGVKLAASADEYFEKSLEAIKTSSGSVPSVMQDIRAGRKTEKEQYLGEIIKYADEKKISVPNLKAMNILLSALEDVSLNNNSQVAATQESFYKSLQLNRGELVNVAVANSSRNVRGA